jgi:hypothetical protein
MIQKRNFPGDQTLDPSSIDNLEYNNAAGAKKVAEVGRHLLAITLGGGAFTTDASTIRPLPGQGKNLAVYNNNTAVGSVTLGEASTQLSLAPGVTDASGHVGIPCAPNSWTYIACGPSNWVISSAATLLVFIIDDSTSIKKQSNDNASV